ncbi:MAG: response regulator [Chloroflexi bacterium]|nr:MAG: response regulator [Chloroflexota bacterium]
MTPSKSVKSRLHRRVLLIEDDPDVRRLIAGALRDVGLDVVPAMDGAQALRTALARKPAAVVLDLGLPDFDGAEFVARWRERRPDAGDVPIVIVSARPDRREVGGLLGARRVFGKPFEVDELVGAVEQATLN